MMGFFERVLAPTHTLLFWQFVLITVVWVALQISAAVCVYCERKWAAYLQQRVGPTRVGYAGLLQPLADILKLMFKENLRPKAADPLLFYLAPIISATACFAAFAVVPFGGETTLFGWIHDGPLRLQVADVNVAVLVIFAIASMGVYGIVLAGWSSNSKYSLLGSLRSSAQMISYELSYGLSLVGVLILANSLSLTDIVHAQRGLWLGFIPKWFIILQPLADILKLLFKEELRPKGADKWLFTLAPMLSITAAFAAFATVPWGAETTFFGLLDQPVKLGVADVNVGILVVFAVTSMGVYGIVLAGWASNSKYSLFGGLRASAQMISYELSYGLSLAAVLLLGNSMSLTSLVTAQAGTWFGFIPRWFVFLQPVGFIVYMIAGIAETNRAPFDFPEAEQELVAGYHTEYSSMSFAMFFLAEYINMVTVSAVATDLFLGGWHGPFLPESLGWIWFLLKVGAILFFYVWMRWTLPRYRYDQLMTFGWKVLLPLSVVNLLATAAAVLYFQ